ncbi:MAG: ABC transporter substrate-binding protein [Dehalococcoidia bacterium]
MKTEPKFNWQQELDQGALTDGEYLESMEIVDEYTLRMHVTEYYSTMVENYGWDLMFSPTAIQNNGVEWARTHAVGTGPFKLVDFKRDVSITYEKNDNYWREGMPYLDGMEIQFIPDVMTARSMLEAGESDVWMEMNEVKHVLDLEKKRYKTNKGLGYLWALLPNSSDPDSPLSDERVRAAIEYAIDRPALVETIGLGEFEPLHQLASSEWPGYVEGYDPRPYNLEKAKQLLDEAGYADGFKIKLLARTDSKDPAAMIKDYLSEVGIEVQLDVADMGRYYASVFSDGWEGLVFTLSGINPTPTDLFVHYGSNPLTYNTGDIKKSDRFLNLCEQALHTFNQAERIDLIKQAVKQAGEDAMIIPLYRETHASVLQPYVHSDYFKLHSVIWPAHKTWMEEH